MDAGISCQSYVLACASHPSVTTLALRKKKIYLKKAFCLDWLKQERGGDQILSLFEQRSTSWYLHISVIGKSPTTASDASPIQQPAPKPPDPRTSNVEKDGSINIVTESHQNDLAPLDTTEVIDMSLELTGALEGHDQRMTSLPYPLVGEGSTAAPEHCFPVFDSTRR